MDTVLLVIALALALVVAVWLHSVLTTIAKGIAETNRLLALQVGEQDPAQRP